jgi:hypothetical protein
VEVRNGSDLSERIRERLTEESLFHSRQVGQVDGSHAAETRRKSGLSTLNYVVVEERHIRDVASLFEMVKTIRVAPRVCSG